MIVKDLRVTVKYSVGLGNVEMPEEAYKQLVEAADNGIAIDPCGMTYLEAADWLGENIKERDCMDWECEVDDISECDGKKDEATS